MTDLRHVQLFRTGMRNGDVYTERDLDDMVAASRMVGFLPPLKIGHEDTPGGRAYGWIENLRREGSVLYGDVCALPDAVYTAIQGRAYNALSAEILWDVDLVNDAARVQSRPSVSMTEQLVS